MNVLNEVWPSNFGCFNMYFGLARVSSSSEELDLDELTGSDFFFCASFGWLFVDALLGVLLPLL